MSALTASDPIPANALKKGLRPDKDALAGDIPIPPVPIGARKSAAVH
jgi:hypothetical protein